MIIQGTGDIDITEFPSHGRKISNWNFIIIITTDFRRLYNKNHHPELIETHIYAHIHIYDVLK